MRLLPQNLDAERSLLGSLLLNGNAVDDVQGLVSAEDFYSPGHLRIYEVISELRQEGIPVDAVSVAEHLQAAQQLEDVGGAPYLGTLLETVPHAAHAEYYAEIVAGKARLRHLIRSCQKAIERAYNEEEDSEIIAEAEGKLHAILERTAGAETVTIAQALEGVFAKLDSDDPPGIPWGLEKLDAMYQLQPGNLVIVAARPSMGKTGLAVNVATNVAKRGDGCGLFSLEMSKMEVTERILSSKAHVSLLKIQKMEPLSEEERMLLLSSSSELAEWPLWIDDNPGLTMTQISAKARLLKRRHGIGLVVVDYIQLIEPDDKKIIREQQVATISRGLKRLAGELDVPVICLAQLNRKNEDRPDRRPRLSDLRESGSLEQDASAVILIHRPEYYNLNDKPGVAELIVAKNRNGKTGIAEVQFDQPTVTFRDLAPHYQSENYGFQDDF